MKGEAPHSNWSIRCISVPGDDTELALFVSFEKTRFLFGCGQGTQRAFVQKRLSMRGLNAVFLPSGTEDGRGGLAGCIMTAADSGIKQMSVIGPSDTSHFIATLRSAVQRDMISIDPISFPLDAQRNEPRQVLVTPNMTVHAIALRPDIGSSDVSSESIPPPMSKRYEGHLPFNPLSQLFKPASLSPSVLRQWTDLVVGDMFGKRFTIPPPRSPPSSPTLNAHPLTTHDGTIRFARPLAQLPLPQVPDRDIQTDMVYICQAPDVRGKFDVEKSNALGLPKGPLRGKLTKGESVEVDDPSVEGGKRIIRPEDCLVGGGPGAVLIVVNCSTHNLEHLLDAGHLRQYQPRVSPDAKAVHVVVHRVPSCVWQDDRYQAWVDDFGPQTHHLLADTQNPSREAFFRSAAWNATQLSLLDPSIFPVPHAASSDPTPVLGANRHTLQPNLEVRMHPPASPKVMASNAKDRPFPTKQAELEWAKDILTKESPEYALACEAAQKAVSSDPRSSQSSSAPGDDITVTTLGTGSAIPSKYRNVSSTHLDIPGVGGILLDCGEGSLGQLRRRFGPEGTRRVMEELRMIYISHMHADHHLGLQSILREKMKVGSTRPFFIVGPQSIGLALAETKAWQFGIDQAILDNVHYLDCYSFKADFPNAWTPPGSPPPSPDSNPPMILPASGWPTVDIFPRGQQQRLRHNAGSNQLLEELGLTSMSCPVVEHRGRAYGLVLQHQSGWKIVYSGDTKPCQALVADGKDATLLIHEATLEDDKPDVAAHKGHSTFSQAIDIGIQMKASHILLNHFSQRYPKFPKLNLPTDPSSSNTAISISFDFMSIKIGDMWKMAHYMDPLSMLFDEAEPEDGDDTMEAVEHDINPSLDQPNANGNPDTNGKGGGGGGKKGKGKQNGLANSSSKSAKQQIKETEAEKMSKRALKKAKRYAVEEEEGNAPVKREKSPVEEMPEAKRPKHQTPQEVEHAIATA